MSEAKSKVRVIKASKDLQLRVGTGTIDDDTVKQAQKVIAETKVDFAPIAKQDLKALEEALSAVQKSKDYEGAVLANFAEPIMNLKANAGSFNYPLVSHMCNSVLTFLETLKGADKKVVQIIDLLYKTVLLIVARQMSGDGGNEGQALKIAFEDVCSRYKPS